MSSESGRRTPKAWVMPARSCAVGSTMSIHTASSASASGSAIGNCSNRRFCNRNAVSIPTPAMRAFARKQHTGHAAGQRTRCAWGGNRGALYRNRDRTRHLRRVECAGDTRTSAIAERRFLRTSCRQLNSELYFNICLCNPVRAINPHGLARGPGDRSWMSMEAISSTATTDFLAEGGELGALMRGHDWSTSPLGTPAHWPQSLKTAVRIMLNSRYPMFVWWGEELINLYNDAYVSVLGQRHPSALGRPAREVWYEIWDLIGAQSDLILKDGMASLHDKVLLIMERNGYPEETYFTFSHSPFPDDDGGIGGVFCACTEDTALIVGQRRLKMLRQLAERTAEEAKTAEDVCNIAASILADYPNDIPCALLYLLDEDQRQAQLAGSTRLAVGGPASPAVIALDGGDTPWPLRSVLDTRKPQTVDRLSERFGPLPGGAWPESPTQAWILPLAKPGHKRLAGFLIAAVSPRLPFTEDYQGFLELTAGHVATAIGNARAYEAERQRAEALAEIDRAKTAFFSNVSHEFRTPLTLIVGPAEEMLGGRAGTLTETQREFIQPLRRNALRLQRLVNAQLDFARVEAERTEASYEPVDLATFTRELVSAFASATERAGLRLTIDCPRLDQPIYVDPDMWEKIVLNLVSNAFKFTFEGGITVSLRLAHP